MGKMVVKCPYCKETIAVDGGNNVPFVRSRITPFGNIKAYRITTDEMKVFLQQKISKLQEGTKIDLVAQSSETFKKKREKERERIDHRIRYKGSIRIAFSHHIVEGSDKNDWFAKVGENDNNPTIINTVLKNVIQKYSYDKKELYDILSNYREMERLEQLYGMNEDFVKEIYAYASPKGVPSGNGDLWVLFSAMPEKIIADMLENPETNKVEGQIEITDVYPISNGVLEYIVYVHPMEMKSENTDLVRKLLLGK